MFYHINSFKDARKFVKPQCQMRSVLTSFQESKKLFMWQNMKIKHNWIQLGHFQVRFKEKKMLSCSFLAATKSCLSRGKWYLSLCPSYRRSIRQTLLEALPMKLEHHILGYGYRLRKVLSLTLFLGRGQKVKVKVTRSNSPKNVSARWLKNLLVLTTACSI